VDDSCSVTAPDPIINGPPLVERLDNAQAGGASRYASHDGAHLLSLVRETTEMRTENPVMV
jgi:hypothetical protein